MKKFISTLILATTVSQISLAQFQELLQIPLSGETTQAAPSEISLSVRTAGPVNLAISLRQLELPEQFASRQESNDYMKNVLDQLRIQDLPGQEGVNRVSLPSKPMQFNTAQIIKDAVADALNLAMGDKILHYDAKVTEVLEASYSLDSERTARMTVNRAFDVINSTIQLTNAPESQALLKAGFYEGAFKLALSQINSNISIYKPVNINDVTRKVLFLGDYGVRFADFMKSHMNAAHLTKTHRAVLVLKTLGYLAWDLQLDVRAAGNTSQTMANLMGKIYRIQKQLPQTQRLLYAIANEQEPNISDLRHVADQVIRIIEAAPGALQAANAELSIR